MSPPGEVAGALSDEFGPFDGRIWLNCAHQGPLPRSAQLAGAKALSEKVNPSLLEEASFAAVPTALRQFLAQLINASCDDILLANSTTYTINLIAQGLPWRERDEVVCVYGDFPATVLPWVSLSRRGVRVKFVHAEGARLDPETLAAALGPRTRVFCSSWVFSFYGHAFDLQTFGEICRERGVWFVLNASQAVGARVLDVAAIPVDAVACCGWKWLCGPYATGFGWVSDALRSEIDYPQPHWQRQRQVTRLDSSLIDYRLANDSAARHLDVYANANFLNFRPFAAAVEHLLAVGPARIAAHDQALVERLLENLDGSSFELRSPRAGSERSTLVLLSTRNVGRTEEAYRRLRENGIDVAVREGSIRISPHLYNTTAEIDRLSDILMSRARPAA